MASRQPTRFLFLDDSGHPAPNYATQAVVIGGFSVASSDVAAINRRLAGAKGAIFPERGRPSQWEVKAAPLECDGGDVSRSHSRSSTAGV